MGTVLNVPDTVTDGRPVLGEHLNGKIVKGIAGFYYVETGTCGILQCKAKGVFRKDNIKPLVGDFVSTVVTDEKDREGNIEEILPRKNTLVRPAVANVDQALYILSVTKPKPNLNLLDRFLCMMEWQGISCVICLNKTDLLLRENDAADSSGNPDLADYAKTTDGQGGKRENETDLLASIYENAGYRVIRTSAKQGIGTDELKDILLNKTTVVAGPSGVGKSTMTNLLSGETVMETGDISKKIERGKNTTRHSECHRIFENTYFIDTPGFGSMFLPDIDEGRTDTLFPEFHKPSESCYFQGCAHIAEPRCGVKDALENGTIAPSRYENYKLLYDELKNTHTY